MIVTELSLSAPVQDTWQVLLDVRRLMGALRGADVDLESVDGGYRGRMSVQLGGVVRKYAGVVRLQDVDEDDRVASYHLFAREVGGRSRAEATITVRVVGDAVATRVMVETEFGVAGHGSRTARSVGEDVAASVFDELGVRLERMVGAGARTAGEPRSLRERKIVLVAGALVAGAIGGGALVRAVRRR